MKLRVVCLIILVAVIAACAPTPSLLDDTFLNDTSLISGTPCEAPCWQTLVPGETAFGAALDFVGNNTDFTNADRQRNRETNEVVLNFSYLDGPQCCRIYSRDGEILSSLLMLLSPNMTVGEVLERYGEPQYFTGQDLTVDQTFISLVYPQRPMVIYAFGAGATTGTLSADNQIIGLSYMSADEMTLLLSTTSLYAWNGFGALADLLGAEPVLTPVADE